MNLNSLWLLVKKSVSAWSDDYAPSMGAALAYYTIFSIAPLLIIVIAVAGLIFGQEAVRGEIAEQLSGLIGKEGAGAIQGLIASASAPSKGIIATSISVCVLIIGATTVFGELQNSLDRIWRSPAPPEKSGIWHLLRTRLSSFGLVLGLGFLLLVSLVISAALAALGTLWGDVGNVWKSLLQLLNFSTSFILETGLFAMIYKIMPRARIDWRDVWTGAAVTALLFEIGKLLIGLYLGKSGVTSGFGAAGSVVVLLVWIYYSAQVFLLGAEFTWVYAHSHGSKVARPEPNPPPRVPTRSGEADPPSAAKAPAAADLQRAEERAVVASRAVPADTPHRHVEFFRRHPIAGYGVVVTAGLVAGTLLRRGLEANGTRLGVGWRKWFG